MWTDEEIQQLNIALYNQNAKEITRLLNVYQQAITSKKALHLKQFPHFLLAFFVVGTHELKHGHKLIQFYLEHSPEIKRVLPYLKRPQTITGLNPTDLTTLYFLYSGLEYLLSCGQTQLFDQLFTKYMFDLNFIIPTKYSLLFNMLDDSKHRANKYPLLFRIATLDKEDLVKFLLAPKYKINIDAELDEDGIKGFTLLFHLCKIDEASESLIQALINHGADPYHPMKLQNHEKEVSPYVLLQLLPNSQAKFEKLCRCIENKKPVVDENDSPEHSDGSPANSAGSSPRGTPPSPSTISKDSTPHMSLGSSRNGSPHGSPTQLTDSDSSGSSPPRMFGQGAGSTSSSRTAASDKSGSAGSSPESNSAQNKSAASENVTTSDQIVIPPGNSLLCKEFGQAHLRKLYDLQKKMYDDGRIKLDCTCKICSKENALQRIFWSNPDVTKYMLYHSKYPADINSVNKDNRTALHLKTAGDGQSRSSFPSRNTILTFTQVYADRKPNLNARDNNGNTPLHLAAASGGENSHEAVEELLKAGADKTIINNAGLTPEEYCIANCKVPDIKEKVLQEFQKVYKNQTLSSTIQQSASQSTITYSKPLPSKPIDVKQGVSSPTYLTSSSGMFPNNAQQPVAHKSTPSPVIQAATDTSQTKSDARNARAVGMLYVPPPASTEFPNRKKDEPKADKKDLGNRVKNLFHIK